MLRVVSEPACYRSCGRLFKTDDWVVEGERIILPLGDDETRADGTLGASAYDFPVRTKAREVELLEDRVTWLSL